MLFEVIGMNTATSIFLIFCALLFGISIGGYIVTLRQGKKTAEPDKESQTSDLIRLRKDPASGALEVAIAEQTFHSVAEMSAVQRTLASYAVNDLRSWLSPGAAADQTPASPAAVAAVTAGDIPMVKVVSEPAPAQPVGPPSILPDFLDQQSDMPAESTEVANPKKRKRVGLIGVLTRALATDTPSKRMVTVSIAVQVNTILQKKLKDTPLESRGICLMELPGQEMVVIIGPDQYDSVNAVPDDEIRGVIQSAVNEWLARSTT
jgi:hypothetical protein